MEQSTLEERCLWLNFKTHSGIPSKACWTSVAMVFVDCVDSVCVYLYRDFLRIHGVGRQED